MFLQIKKIGFASEGTHAKVPGLLAADVNDQDQILLRVKVEDGFFIRVLDRFGREGFPAIPSACNHGSPSIVAHPSDPHSVLESCLLCEVIRNYNIYTGECYIVQARLGPIRMCHGPSDCVLVKDFLSPRMTVSQLKWVKEERQLQVAEVYKMNGKIQKWCYAESFNVLVIMSFDKEVKAVKLESDSPIWKLSGMLDGQLIDPDPLTTDASNGANHRILKIDGHLEAVKMGSNNTIWKLSGVVDGHMIKPDAITNDKEGNIYVSDGANNRILKINGSNGDVLSTLLLEKKNTEPIRDLLWSDTEPNLIAISEDRISSYCFEV